MSSKLYLALSHRGRDSLVDELLDSGADVDEPAMVDSMFINGKPYGVTPIWAAVVAGNLKYLPRLLGSGRTEIPKAVTRFHDAEGRLVPDLNILEKIDVVRPGIEFQRALKQVVDAIVPDCPDVPPALWRLADKFTSDEAKDTLRVTDLSRTSDIFTCLALGAAPPTDSEKSAGEQWGEMFARRYMDPFGADDEWDRYLVSAFMKRMPETGGLLRRALNTGLSPDQDIGDYRLAHMAARYDNIPALEAIIEAGGDLRHPLKVPVRHENGWLRTPAEIAKAYGSRGAEHIIQVTFAREKIDAVLKPKVPVAP